MGLFWAKWGYLGVLFGEISVNNTGSLTKKAVWMYLIRSVFLTFVVSPRGFTVGNCPREINFSSVANEMSRTQAAVERGIMSGIRGSKSKS